MNRNDDLFYKSLAQLTGVDYRETIAEHEEQAKQPPLTHLLDLHFLPALVSEVPAVTVLSPSATTVEDLAFVFLDELGLDDRNVGWVMVLPFGLPGRRRVPLRTNRSGPAASLVYLSNTLWSDAAKRAHVAGARKAGRGKLCSAAAASIEQWLPGDEIFWCFGVEESVVLLRVRVRRLNDYSHRLWAKIEETLKMARPLNSSGPVVIKE